MSDGGEKTCPLCAEEMDLTDQHLKPCKCGYEICVWCWHHIMGMAEKEDTEGRCPACRNPYNKEKIVGMTANHERLVSEMNVEKKLKSQKGKSKTSEGRKQLGNVRVIQRNLVYVVGLPLDLANDELLQRSEYFSQYGKVLKVTISRTSAGAIQQFANSTCSVYITYSKEEEAVRCIQSVTGFVLDGRPLKACFGTTKYCHAWLRNVACTNPDCLYLHEIGSQEDSFTKDEVISSYTRSRVQQITGAVNSTQRSSGNVLPPPVDDYCNNTSASKPITKTVTTTNNSASSVGDSPPNSSRSVALPPGASWGTRPVNNQSSSISCSNGPIKPDACNDPVKISTEVATSNQVSSSQNDTGNKSILDEPKPVSQDKSKPETISPVKKDSSLESTGPAVDNDSIDITDGNIENICSDMSSMGIQGHVEKITEPVSEIDDELLFFDKQRLNDPEVINRNQIPDFLNSFMSNHSNIHSPRFNNADSSIGVGFDRQVVDRNGNFGSSFPINHLDYSNGGVNTGENNIISNIFSMDFDSFDESLISPRNIDKLLGGNDKRQGSFGPPGPRKTQNGSNQSRFSFAREEPMMSRQVSEFGPSIDYFEQDFKQRSFGSDFSNNNGSHHKFATQNGFPNFNGTESDIFASSHHQNKISVSRPQVSAPPGFAAPNRTRLPGFTSYERTEQSTFSGNNIFESASLLRNQSQDIELTDPAILKVIKGTLLGGAHSAGPDIRSSFSDQLSSFEDSRFRSFLQKRSLPPNPNQRFNDLADNFTPIGGDAYGLPSRVVMEQTLANNLSQFSQYIPQSNVQWNNGWNEFSSGDNLGMAELLRNERLGYNKFYNGYEDSKIRMPGSGNLYNGTYGI